MTAKPPLPNPHDVNYKRAIARALEMERDIEHSEEQAREQAQRAVRSAAVVGIAALFCVTYVILLYGQLALFNSGNVFVTLALNLGLWLVGTLCMRTARRPR